MLLLVILPAVGMQILYVSAINVALPTITSDLGLSAGVAQLVVVAYPISLAVILIPAGRWGDAYTPRRIYQWGLALFLFGSAFAACAPDIYYLLAGRILQGIAAGLLLPQVLSIIQREFVALRRARAMGFYSVAIATAILVGPLFGGALIDIDFMGLSWRNLFLIAVPASAILWLASITTVPRYERLPAGSRNLVTIVLLIVGVFCLTATVTLVRDMPIAVVFALMLVSVTAIALFVRRERSSHERGDVPLVRRSLLRQPSFRLGLLANVFFFLAVPTLSLSITFYLQLGIGFSAFAAGAAVLWSSFGELPGGLIVARIINRFGEMTLVLGGLLMVCGYVLVALSSLFVLQLGVMTFMVSLVFWGLGLGVVAPSILTYSTQHVTNAEIGSASGLLNMSQQFSASMGLGVSSVIFFGVLGAGDVGRDAAQGALASVTQLVQSGYWHALLFTVLYQGLTTLVGLGLLVMLVRSIRRERT